MPGVPVAPVAPVGPPAASVPPPAAVGPAGPAAPVRSGRPARPGGPEQRGPAIVPPVSGGELVVPPRARVGVGTLVAYGVPPSSGPGARWLTRAT